MIRLYTIGHSRHTPEKFSHLLIENGIQILVDVRTAPYSRFSPWFNKDDLEFDLSRHQIQYIYGGKYLGGRPPEPGLYKSRKLPEEDVDYLHEVDYPAVMKRPWFIKAIEELLETIETGVTAIMCSEEDPAACHRHHLIARFILDNFPEVEVIHIRGDGTIFGAKSILKSVNKPEGKQERLF